MTVDLNPIILAVIGAAVTLLTVYMTRVNTNTTKLIEKTDQIHSVVNSNQTAMQKAIDTLTAQVLNLSASRATLIEEARGKELAVRVELATARAEQPPRTHDQRKTDSPAAPTPPAAP